MSTENNKKRKPRKPQEVFDLETFLIKARRIHGDEYNYDKVIYNGIHNLIIVTCKKHGDFQLLMHNHLKEHKCWDCQFETDKARDVKKITQSQHQIMMQKEFIKKANERHNNKYDYSEFVYTSKQDKAVFICPRHGKFIQQIATHIKSNGCYRCGKETERMTNEKFIKISKEKHGDRYDYSKVECGMVGTHVSIICKTHGVFEQDFHHHMYGAGCKKMPI